MYLYLAIVCYALLCIAMFSAMPCYGFRYILLCFCYVLLCFTIRRYVPLFTFRVATE